MSKDFRKAESRKSSVSGKTTPFGAKRKLDEMMPDILNALEDFDCFSPVKASVAPKPRTHAVRVYQSLIKEESPQEEAKKPPASL